MPAEKIPLTPITSSNLAAIGYHAAKQILGVEFKGGGIFHYAGVGPEVYQQLLEAPSRGSFFAKIIRGKFQGEKMTGPCLDCGAHGWIGETCAQCGCSPYQQEPYVPKRRA
jgi:hypothetical protein